MEDEGRESLPIENLGKISISNELLDKQNEQEGEIETKPKKNCFKFPTSYTILIIIEIFIFLLTYIIQKGLFDTIEYSSEDKIFIIRKHDVNNTIIKVNATQEELDKRSISVPLESFLDGIINKPIAIPNTYKKIEGETTDFFNLFSYPIKGLIETADICFFVLIIGGAINLLIEMDSLSAGMRALSRAIKGKEFLLLILIVSLVSIAGSAYGMYEEIISFYPIIMPIFLMSGFDAILSMAPLYMAVICGTMFSTLNPTAVVIASVTAGINFIDGIVLRIIGLAFGIIIAILYLFIYYKRIQRDETKSITYDIKMEILDKYSLLDKKEGNKEEAKDKISEEEPLKENLEENKNDNKNEEFTLKQKISLIIFLLGIISLILGVILLEWSILQMTTVFLILAVIFMFLLNKGEEVAINSFMRGAGDFCGVTMVIGIARGINLTLEQEKISDTILDSMSNLVDGLPKVAFVMILFIIYIILGFFISSTSGLAVLSMPPFAPLADKIHCSRAVVVDIYMFGQLLIALISPTGLILIVTQLVGIKYTHWLRFIWPYMLILYVYLNTLLIIDVYIS